MPAKKSATSKPTRSKRKTTAAKKTASPKGRVSSSKAKAPKAGDEQVTIDRRRSADRRRKENAEEMGSSSQPNLERRAKVQRRRQIDPTTCERDYSTEEVEFMNSMDEYKRKSGRMFPTCSEVLEVIRELGYVKLSTAELASLRPTDSTSTVVEHTDSDMAEPEPESESETAAVVMDGWTI